MGMKAVRQSRKYHPMPIMRAATDRATKGFDVFDPSAPVRSRSVAAPEKGSMVPKKQYPVVGESKYPTTPVPDANVDGFGREGGRKSRQHERSGGAK